MWLQRTRVTPGPTMPLNPWLRLIPIESWVEFEININLKWELMDGPEDGCMWHLMIFDVVWCFYRIVRNDADVDVLDCSWFFLLYLAGHADGEASPDCSILLSQRFPATNGGPNSKERTAALFVIYPSLRVELHCFILEREPDLMDKLEIAMLRSQHAKTIQIISNNKCHLSYINDINVFKWKHN